MLANSVYKLKAGGTGASNHGISPRGLYSEKQHKYTSPSLFRFSLYHLTQNQCMVVYNIVFNWEIKKDMAAGREDMLLP